MIALNIEPAAKIAVMHKIILTAHFLYKNNSKYDENFNYQKGVTVNIIVNKV